MSARWSGVDLTESAAGAVDVFAWLRRLLRR